MWKLSIAVLAISLGVTNVVAGPALSSCMETPLSAPVDSQSPNDFELNLYTKLNCPGPPSQQVLPKDIPFQIVKIGIQPETVCGCKDIEIGINDNIHSVEFRTQAKPLYAKYTAQFFINKNCDPKSVYSE